MTPPIVKDSQPIATPAPANEAASQPLADGVEGPVAPQASAKPKGKVLDHLAIEVGAVVGGDNLGNGEGLDHFSPGFVGGVYGRINFDGKKAKEDAAAGGTVSPSRNHLLLGVGVSYNSLTKKSSNSLGNKTGVFAHFGYLRDVNEYFSFGPYLRLGATIFTTPGCASFSEFTPDLCAEGRLEVSGATEADKITLDGTESPPAVAALVSPGMRFSFLKNVVSLDVGLSASLGAVATVTQLVGGDKSVPFQDIGAQVALNFDIISAARWARDKKRPKKADGEAKSLPVGPGGDTQSNAAAPSSESVSAPLPQLPVEPEAATIEQLQGALEQNVRVFREWVVSDDKGETKLENAMKAYLEAKAAKKGEDMAFELGQLRDLSAQMTAFYQETHEIYVQLKKKVTALPDSDPNKDRLMKDLGFAKTQFHANRDELFFSAFETVQGIFNAAKRANEDYLKYQKSNPGADTIEFNLEAPKALEKSAKARPDAQVDPKGKKGSSEPETDDKKEPAKKASKSAGKKNDGKAESKTVVDDE